MQAEKIVFDLEKPPITGAQLQQAAAKLDRSENARILQALAEVILFVAVATGAAIFFFNPQGSAFSFLFGTLILFLTIGLFAIFERTEKKGSEIETQLARLRAIPPEGNAAAGYLELAELARKDPVISRYFQAVAAQKRVPVLGELEAADAWVSAERERQTQEQARAAWQSGMAGEERGADQASG